MNRYRENKNPAYLPVSRARKSRFDPLPAYPRPIQTDFGLLSDGSRGEARAERIARVGPGVARRLRDAHRRPTRG